MAMLASILNVLMVMKETMMYEKGRSGLPEAKRYQSSGFKDGTKECPKESPKGRNGRLVEIINEEGVQHDP